MSNQPTRCRGSTDEGKPLVTRRLPPAPPPAPPIFVSPAEAARLLGISRASLYLLFDDGTVPSRKLGGRRVVPLKFLRDLADEAA